MDTVSPDVRSRTMRAVKGKNTTLEMKFRQALWSAGVRGWRLHINSLPGKPDLVFSAARVVVFIDSCFWHGCPAHLRMPSSNLNYWEAKIARNRKRDKVVTKELKTQGWTVLRFWEHNIRENLEKCVFKVNRIVTKQVSR
jgi:DNA mismatch endonuclease, patch repair protein